MDFTKKIFLFFALVLFAFHIYAQNDIGLGSSTANQNLRGNGMKFTQNKGQIVDMEQNLRPDILFKGDGGGIDVYLRKTGVSYVLNNLAEVIYEVDNQVKLIGNGEGMDSQKLKEIFLQKQFVKLHRIDMDFVNANTNAEIQVNNQVEGYTNYYYAHCPEGITHTNSYNEVTFKNIYKNIDIKYYASASPVLSEAERLSTGGLKYDIIVNPGGNPDDIQLKYRGADKLIIKDGELRIKNSVNELIEKLPKVYQNINEKIVDVKTEYQIEHLSNNDIIVHFSFSTFNSSFPLVIDPWATYYGGSSAMDLGTGIATDNANNVVISGTTMSANLPVLALAGGYTQPFGGGATYDAFAVKFNSAGIRLWATYYGGSNRDDGNAIATDSNGNVMITGFTQSTNFPVQSGSQMGYGGGICDAFIVKFDPSGVRLWATFYGGASQDYGYGIASDNSSNIIITGHTQGNGFPVLAAFQPVYGGGFGDAYVTKFNSAGTCLWSTYYGGPGYDKAQGVAIDNADNVVIAGIAGAAGFPVFSLPGGYSQAFLGGGGVGDACVVKFNSAGVRQWACIYGGSGFEMDLSIAIDNLNNVIITGTAFTAGAGFPVSVLPGGYAQAPSASGGDVFVIKFDPTGKRLWGTIYGMAIGRENSHGIATDVSNNIYLLMETEDIPGSNVTDACSYQPLYLGYESPLIVKFNTDGKKICATYIGGNGHNDEDGAYDAITVNGNFIYIAGSSGGGFPVTPGAFQTAFAGPDYDATVMSLCINICEANTLELNFAASTTNVCTNVPVTFTPSVNNSCDTTGYKFQWTFNGGTPTGSTAVNPIVSYSSAGNYSIKLVLTTACKKDSITKTNYITINSCGCALTASTISTIATCGSSNGTVSVNPTGGNLPYTYSWNNGQTSQTATGLTPGTYTVKITDANGGCSTTASATIISPPPLTGQFTKGTASCAGCGCKQWILVNAAGGTSPYSYTWPDGYVNRYKNQLCPGAYMVNIEDKNGCSVNVNVTVP